MVLPDGLGITSLRARVRARGEAGCRGKLIGIASQWGRWLIGWLGLIRFSSEQLVRSFCQHLVSPLVQ